MRLTGLAASLLLALAAAGCSTPSTPRALLLAMAAFEKGVTPATPKPAGLGILTPDGDSWSYRLIEDADSNVFHKAMLFEPRPGEVGILTAGGTRAILKLWRKAAKPEVIWEADFGGAFSRMRDVEIGDIRGDGVPTMAVATHDQGVVALVWPRSGGGFDFQELDRRPGTIVHEVEIGDLDGDHVLEVYATPSQPNKLDGTPQPGEIVRYVPARHQGRSIVATLGTRHAKEILCSDVDGDGRDELYASVEAVEGGQVEILRYDAGTPPDSGVRIATLDDQLCRFLTAGDVDGDGKREIVAAAHRSGLWLLRPGKPWSVRLIDGNSSGFEHAAILTDLDGDGVDELYAANDAGLEVNRYVWHAGAFRKTTIHRHPANLSVITWNIMPAPVSALPTPDPGGVTRE